MKFPSRKPTPSKTPCYPALSIHTCTRLIPLPLKILARTHEGHALVHDHLANPEVAIDPFGDLFRLGDGFGLDTGAGRSQHGHVLAGDSLTQTCAPDEEEIAISRLGRGASGKRRERVLHT